MERPDQEIIPPQTNDIFLSLYTFCEPKICSGETCLVCQENFSPEDEVKKHLRSKEHAHNFSLKNKVPHQTTKWWEPFEGESDIQHFLRVDIATTLGPLPSYIKCIFAYSTIWFLSWSPSKDESMKARTSRGELPEAIRILRHFQLFGNVSSARSISMDSFWVNCLFIKHMDD
ncbi:hypothetical protein MAR_ORF037 [Marseillevirus marseillevirus]|jgi:hypothetical protein|uniref:C2H2-type domain-containing protein n=1 Tax=Marseillevirus marseillevirus TaxID=694581 RepID=D2XA49_GBMV|nr:hypothetical protein MAR_ORF037 [Marseillevirus marseillevirus]ADB03826.1 hypothetical protein MAR_ORF037 [Marseillevirus marseillevirus]